ncbi:MAG: hypothetical protein ACU0BF_06845 [Paracoccaceae bacterium]
MTTTSWKTLFPTPKPSEWVQMLGVTVALIFFGTGYFLATQINGVEAARGVEWMDLLFVLPMIYLTTWLARTRRVLRGIDG